MSLLLLQEGIAAESLEYIKAIKVQLHHGLHHYKLRVYCGTVIMDCITQQKQNKQQWEEKEVF